MEERRLERAVDVVKWGRLMWGFGWRVGRGVLFGIAADFFRVSV